MNVRSLNGRNPVSRALVRPVAESVTLASAQYEPIKPLDILARMGAGVSGSARHEHTLMA